MKYEPGARLKGINDEIPKVFKEATFDGIRSEVLKKMVINMVEINDTKGIYLWGGPGCGKTFSLYGILEYLKSRNCATYLVKSLEITDAIRDILNYNLDGTDKKADSEKFLEDIRLFPGVLLIDDLGAEKFTEAVITEYYRITNYRYEERLTTVYTSNYNLDALADKVGERVSSRVDRTTHAIDLSEIK